MLYLIIIIVSMLSTAVINISVNKLFFDFPIWFIFVAVIVSTVAVIAVDGLFATIIRRLLPAKWFSHERKFFKVSKKEVKIYERMRIRKWKDKVVELGMFTNFRKNKLSDPYNNDYILRFLLESNYGIIIHIVCIFIGYLIIFIFPLKYALCFGVPIASVNAILNIPPILILRYNTPKLRALYKYNLRKKPKEDDEVLKVESEK